MKIFKTLKSKSKNLNCLQRNYKLIPIPKTPTKSQENEYLGPKIVTEKIPGPKTIKMLEEEMSKSQPLVSKTTHFIVDQDNSRGNYIADIDGNIFLDVMCHIASLSVGYNNPNVLEALKKDQDLLMKSLLNRPSLGLLAPSFWPKLLEDSIMKVAPKGMTQVFTTMCGNCANESAFKSAMIAYTQRMRGSSDPTQEELQTCLCNQVPGSKDLAVLSFGKAFHGRLLGALSATHSKSVHKLDFPSFNWPIAPFPQLQYPLETNAPKNKEEEARCLDLTETIIKKWNIKGQIAAMIIEPIQAEGGDNHASAGYFKQLRSLATKYNIAFIVDEVQTGVGATGVFWAHESWGLETPPDAVTFSKKMQAAGFYHAENMMPKQGGRNFNTWMGDPVRVLLAKALIEEIERNHLIENTRITGSFLQDGLKSVAEKHPSLIHGVRGAATFCAFDCNNPAEQAELLSNMKQRGVEIIGCGERSIRLRPMLTFEPKHAVLLLDILDDSLISMKKK